MAGLRIAELFVVSRPFPAVRQVLTDSGANRNVVSPSDELFFHLEGQIVSGRSGSWRVEVCGVYSTDNDRWIQLNLTGPYRCGVTLRAGFRESTEVIDLLVDWLDDTLAADLEPCIVSQASRPEPHSRPCDPGGAPAYMM
jgi:hypothetical protein